MYIRLRHYNFFITFLLFIYCFNVRLILNFFLFSIIIYMLLITIFKKKTYLNLIKQFETKSKSVCWPILQFIRLIFYF